VNSSDCIACSTSASWSMCERPEEAVEGPA
jgi:hypothetical protein